MFENTIRNTRLTGALADNMFRHINGSSYDGDVSFLSNLRALLMNRMPREESIDLHHAVRSLRTEGVNVASVGRLSNALTVINCFSDIGCSKEEIELQFNSILVPDEYSENTDVRAFFAQKMMCRVFVCEELHSTIVLIADMDMKRYHLVQCIIPKLLPWYFDCKTLTANERALLHTLYGRAFQAYESALVRLTDNDDFRVMMMSATLNSMKRRSFENQKNAIESSVNDCTAAINTLNDRLSEKFKEKNRLLHRLIGIETAIAQENYGDASKELNDFIKSAKCIECVDSGSDDSIAIVVKGYLDVYDPDDYKAASMNRNGWYWNVSTRNFHDELKPYQARKKVLDSIFSSNPTFKIRTCGYYRLDMESCTVRSSSLYDYGARYNDCYVNPHLNYHACLGSYRSVINEALANGDIVAALSRCITSVHTVNVVEGASFSHLTTDLFEDYNRPFLVGPDGNSYTTLQAYRYLCAQEMIGE